VGVLLAQGRVDHRQNSVPIAKSILVPKAQDSITLALDQLCSDGIARFITAESSASRTTI
jgi:hypothetical protein